MIKDIEVVDKKRTQRSTHMFQDDLYLSDEQKQEETDDDELSSEDSNEEPRNS